MHTEEQAKNEKNEERTKAEALLYTKDNAFAIAQEEKIEKMQAYAIGYKNFLDIAKTEREAVNEGIKMATAFGYTPYIFGEKLEAGEKRYYNNRGKNLFLIRKGTASLAEDGIRILAAHVDSPRIDLKQIPLFEDGEMAFFKTHYYGGIRKYQWVATPLALHGVVVKQNGDVIDIVIGEEETDPLFYITDLLPHLATEQGQKTLNTAIQGEKLNILVGGMPLAGDKGADAIKLNVLRLLNEKYGIVEADLMSAEISAVPAFKARDIGFDRAFIGAYGHDDRVCAYPAMSAMFELATDTHTVITILADKEEIGSVGATGMRSRLLGDIMADIATADGVSDAVVRSKSKCLSADVNAAYDPNYAEVFEKRNASLISCGTVMSKYTGSRGKSGTSDASAEFVGFIRRIFDENNIAWQTGELGKVDIGGGGTVAQFIADMNIDTIDIGVPVISMHAPYELISKADLYATYQAFVAFCK